MESAIVVRVLLRSSFTVDRNGGITPCVTMDTYRELLWAMGEMSVHMKTNVMMINVGSFFRDKIG